MVAPLAARDGADRWWAVIVEFFVAGQVAAKGSLRPFTFRGKDGKTHVRMAEQLTKTKPWLACVTAAAHVAMAGRPRFEQQPLHVTAVFGFTRPKSHYGARGLKSGAPLAPLSPPDLDKLQRAIGDALKGVVFDDDSRIVLWSPAKVFVQAGASTGALVRIEPVEAFDVLSAGDFYRAAQGQES